MHSYQKKISIIISNYNERDLVEGCLRNLENIYPNFEVLVKNQGSTDGSVELIKRNFPWVIVIDGDNVGLSASYNKAVKEASGSYFLFLGMDAFPTKDSLSFLVDYMEKNPNVGLATLKLILDNGNMDMDCHRAFPTPFNAIMKFSGLGRIFPRSRIFNGFFLPNEDLNKAHEIDNCISHFMFVRKEAFDSVGGFDEDYFLWGEDIDFCYRLKTFKNWKIMFLPQYTCLHLKGGSLGIRSTTRHLQKKPLNHRLKMQKLSTEAMNLFMKKHYMEKYPKPILVAMFIAAGLMGKFRVFMESFR